MVSNQICVRDDLAKEKVAKQKKFQRWATLNTIDMKHRRTNATFEIPRTTYFSAFVPNPKSFNTITTQKDALHRCYIHLGECENDTTNQLIFLTTQPKNEESKITTCSIHEAWNDERQTPQLSTRPGQREPNNAIVAMHKQSRQNLGKQNSNLHCKSNWRGQIRKLAHFIFFFKWPSTSSWNPHSWVSNWQEKHQDCD